MKYLGQCLYQYLYSNLYQYQYMNVILSVLVSVLEVVLVSVIIAVFITGICKLNPIVCSWISSLDYRVRTRTLYLRDARCVFIAVAHLSGNCTDIALLIGKCLLSALREMMSISISASLLVSPSVKRSIDRDQ